MSVPRKSTRKNACQLEVEVNNKILAHTDDGLEVFETENRGRGVRTLKDFEKGEFLCEYAGNYKLLLYLNFYSHFSHNFSHRSIN